MRIFKVFSITPTISGIKHDILEDTIHDVQKEPSSAENSDQRPSSKYDGERVTSEVSRHITTGHRASGAALKQILLAATHPSSELDTDDVLDPMEKAISHHRQALLFLESVRQQHAPDESRTSKD